MGYIIKKGDTGSAIAKQNGMSLAELQRLNPNVDLNKIQIGQSLNLTSNNTPQSSTTPERLKPGAYYLSYPGHKISVKGQIPGMDANLPLGHAGVVIVGDDGLVTQYDYGRYTKKAIGNVKEEVQGNWTKTPRSRLDLNNATMQHLLKQVADTGSKASQNVRLTYAHDADPQKVLQYIEDDSKDVNRTTYGIPLLSKAKWENLTNKNIPLSERISDLFTAKGCATSAYDAIQAGTPTTSRISGLITAVRNTSPLYGAYRAAKELLSSENDGIGADVSFAPRSRERRLQEQGYKTYDSKNY